ncbi:phage major capsid protein, partial [Singulisphaera rosea]
MPRLSTSAYLDGVNGQERDLLPHHEPKNLGKYSLARAIDVRASHRELDGLEGEVSQELAKRYGRNPIGFFLPWDVQVRSLDTSTGSGGVTQILSPVVDVLRAKSLCASLGALVMPDLRGGRFGMPLRTATAALTWTTEGSAPSGSSTPMVDQVVPFEPRTVGAYVDMSVKARVSIPGSDELIINDLLAAVAVEVDRVAFSGLGTTNEPLGIIHNPGVLTQTIGTNGGPPT